MLGVTSVSQASSTGSARASSVYDLRHSLVINHDKPPSKSPVSAAAMLQSPPSLAARQPPPARGQLQRKLGVPVTVKPPITRTNSSYHQPQQHPPQQHPPQQHPPQRSDFDFDVEVDDDDEGSSGSSSSSHEPITVMTRRSGLPTTPKIVQRTTSLPAALTAEPPSRRALLSQLKGKWFAKKPQPSKLGAQSAPGGGLPIGGGCGCPDDRSSDDVSTCETWRAAAATSGNACAVKNGGNQQQMQPFLSSFSGATSKTTKKSSGRISALQRPVGDDVDDGGTPVSCCQQRPAIRPYKMSRVRVKGVEIKVALHAGPPAKKTPTPNAPRSTGETTDDDDAAAAAAANSNQNRQTSSPLLPPSSSPPPPPSSPSSSSSHGLEINSEFQKQLRGGVQRAVRFTNIEGNGTPGNLENGEGNQNLMKIQIFRYEQISVPDALTPWTAKEHHFSFLTRRTPAQVPAATATAAAATADGSFRASPSSARRNARLLSLHWQNITDDSEQPGTGTFSQQTTANGGGERRAEVSDGGIAGTVEWVFRPVPSDDPHDLNLEDLRKEFFAAKQTQQQGATSIRSRQRNGFLSSRSSSMSSRNIKCIRANSSSSSSAVSGLGRTRSSTPGRGDFIAHKML